MASPFSITRISQENGLSSLIRTGSDTSGNSCEALLIETIGDGRLKEPGVYCVSWVNGSNSPTTRIFTVEKGKMGLVVRAGLPPSSSPLVTRWPPRK